MSAKGVPFTSETSDELEMDFQNESGAMVGHSQAANDVNLTTESSSTVESMLWLLDPSPSVLAWPLWLQVILGVIAGVVTLVTILANISVLYAFARTRRLHTYANYYIISLASVDLFSGFVATPFVGANWALGYWPFGDIVCFVTNKTLSFSAFHTSYLSTLVIALDRYFSVAYPLKHLTYRTTKVASVVIFLTYAIPVAIWWPFSFYWRWIYEGEFPLFTYICFNRYLSSPYATVFVIVTLTWLPILIMVIVYVKVYRLVQVSQRNRQIMRTTGEVQSEAATSSRIYDVNTIQVDLQPSQSEARVNPVFTVDDESPYDDVIENPQVLAPERGTTPRGESGEGGVTSARLPASSKKKKKRGSKALRTLTPIFIAMMVSGVPWAVIALLLMPCPECLPMIIMQTAVYLSRVSGAMNPFCYAIANPLYRQGILRLVSAKKKQRRQ